MAQEAAPGAPTAPWSAMLERCLAVLGRTPGVRALILAGSGAAPETLDAWSDVDLVVLTGPAQAGAMFADRRWLADIGGVFASNTSSGPDRWTIRVCFDDLARVDFILADEAGLAALRADGPLSHGERVVFGAIGGTDGPHPHQAPTPAPPATEPAGDAVARLGGELRWNAVLAAVKVARGDLLIGTHLALAAAQAPLVLAMLLRDRRTGTRHHRRGDGRFPPAWTRPLPTVGDPAQVLDLLAWAAEAWSALLPQWDAAATDELRPLHALLAQVAATLTRG